MSNSRISRPIFFAAGKAAPSFTQFQDLLATFGFSQPEQLTALEELLSLSGIWESKGESIPLNQASANSETQLLFILKLVKSSQQAFTLRSGTQERWETKPLAWMKDHQQTILTDLTTLGFVEAITPCQKKPDAICILGATRPTMANRLAYTKALLEGDTRTSNLILLAGERYVTAGVDGNEAELQSIASKLNLSDWRKLTETHLLEDLYESSGLQKNLNTTVLDTPRGNLPRPTTQTTLSFLLGWLKDKPQLNHILFISNQPNVRYQEAVINAALLETGNNLQVEVVGPAVKNEQEIKFLLEELGSYIWAKAPYVIAKLDLKMNDDNIRKEFQKIYTNHPLIFTNFTQHLRSCLK